MRCGGLVLFFGNTREKHLVLRFLMGALWIPVLAYSAEVPSASWRQYVDQAVQLQKAGHLAEADQAFAAAAQAAEKLGADHLAVASVLLQLGGLHAMQHDFPAARSSFERSLSITEKAFGADDPAVGVILTNIAVTYHSENQYAAAEPLYRRALSILEKTLGKAQRYTAIAEVGMARLFLAQGRNTEAEASLQKAIPILESSREPNDSSLAIALTDLAEAYRIDGRYAKAEPFYRQVLAMVRENPAQESPEVVEGLNHFTAILRKTKRKAEARELDAQINSIFPKP